MWARCRERLQVRAKYFPLTQPPDVLASHGYDGMRSLVVVCRAGGREPARKAHARSNRERVRAVLASGARFNNRGEPR